MRLDRDLSCVIALVLGLAWLMSTSLAVAQEKRVALVIGNGAYRATPALLNPPNDARDMAAALKRVGFIDVTLVLNATKAQMERAIREFGQKLDGASAALVFYAGHAVQVDGRNYLLPVDAKIERAQDLNYEVLDVGVILAELDQGKRTNIVILDACRHNPLAEKMARSMPAAGRSIGGIGQGLARIDGAVGTLIAYSTKDGTQARDGEGRNSPYTKALLKHIDTPGLPVEAMFKRVRETVRAETGDEQTPWEYGSLIGGDFYFNVTVNVSSPAAQPGAQADREAQFWQSVAQSGRIEEYQAYLTKYPNGAFAPLATSRIDALRDNAKSPAGSEAPSFWERLFGRSTPSSGGQTQQPPSSAQSQSASKPEQQVLLPKMQSGKAAVGAQTRTQESLPWVPVALRGPTTPKRDHISDLKRLPDLAKRILADLPPKTEEEERLIARALYGEILCQAGDRAGALAILEDIKTKQVAKIESTHSIVTPADRGSYVSAWRVLSYVPDAYLHCGMQDELRKLELPAKALLLSQAKKFQNALKNIDPPGMSLPLTFEEVLEYSASILFFMGEYDRGIALVDAGEVTRAPILARITAAKFVTSDGEVFGGQPAITMPPFATAMRKTSNSQSARTRAIEWLREAAKRAESFCSRPETTKEYLCKTQVHEILSISASLGSEENVNSFLPFIKKMMIGNSESNDNITRDELWTMLVLVEGLSEYETAERAKKLLANLLQRVNAQTVTQSPFISARLASIGTLLNDPEITHRMLQTFPVPSSTYAESSIEHRENAFMAMARALMKRGEFASALGYLANLNDATAYSRISMLTKHTQTMVKAGANPNLLLNAGLLIKKAVESAVERDRVKPEPNGFPTQDVARALSIVREAGLNETAYYIETILRRRGLPDSGNDGGDRVYAALAQVLDLDFMLDALSQRVDREKQMNMLAKVAEGIAAQRRTNQ